jgi:hypothetical protein
VVAAYAVRANGSREWSYACGWHVARVTRNRVAASVDGKAITEMLG